ncbi:MAG: signal peptidase I [Promethearchaeota archaeon]
MKKIENISKKQKKEAILALLMIAVAVGGTFAFLGILRLSLHTDNPLVVVTSESMVPTINVGDILVIEGKDPADIKNGTIILYDSRGLWPNRYVEEPIVHRVVNKYLNDTDNKWYFITKGDNNDDTDPPDGPFGTEIPIPEERVIGIVTMIIPKIGKVKIWMDDIPGLSTIFLVGLSIALVISIIWDLTHPEDEEEDKKKEKDEIEETGRIEEEPKAALDNEEDKKSNIDLGI